MKSKKGQPEWCRVQNCEGGTETITLLSECSIGEKESNLQGFRELPRERTVRLIRSMLSMGHLKTSGV